MTAKLTASLREAPATVPALVALALFVVWATNQAGYPVTHWAPGALIVMGLLLVAFLVLGFRPAETPVPVRIALAALAAYTAWSFLSILWASAPGVAWEGADRTLLYLVVLALFSWWRQRGATAALLLVVWVLALTALAAFTAVHVDAAGSVKLRSLIVGGRLFYPTGYPNANAAQWLMAAWPALLLARERLLPWILRGLLAGGAVLLAEVALLSQSRGSMYATPVMLVLVFVLLPGRLRTFAVLVPAAAAVAAAAPAILRVGDHLRAEAVVPSTLHHATHVMFATAIAVALVVAAAALIEDRAALSLRAQGRVRAVVRAFAVASLLAVVATGLAVAGNPVRRAENAWRSFKHGYGSGSSSGSRLIGGLGSARYDFYRVALDELAAHPLLGIGADNFEEQYLEHGRSEETPHYPHSVEMRTLVETGLVGALLALVGLGAALLAGLAALRRPDALARGVTAAALSGFAYWVVHGSFDWFWEFAGLGATAFALLGIACSLAPEPGSRRRSASPRAAPRPAPPGVASAPGAEPRRVVRPPWLGRPRGIWAKGLPALCAVVLAVVAFVPPWLSQLQVESAASVWTSAPRTAYSRLDDAAGLDPLSDEAYLVAGSIALRVGELARARHDFSRALGRSADDAYATLELGAIDSATGAPERALSLLERAVHLDPRDELVRETLHVVKAGRRVDIGQLNRAILLKAQQLA